MKMIYKMNKAVATLLIMLMISLMGNAAYRALTKFYMLQGNSDTPLTISEYQMFLRGEFLKEWMRFTASPQLSDEESPLETFHIVIAQEFLDLLNKDLPSSGKENYVDAFMKVSSSDKMSKIKLRYRGKIASHWMYKQKSLRIKMVDGGSHNMDRIFNLVNPAHEYFFTDQVAYKIARDHGLISPDYYPVRVFMNGEFMGIYMYLSQVKESLLRKHKLMPGSIYYGEGGPKREDGVSSLWYDPDNWDKSSSRNAEQEANREDINLFISELNKDDSLEFYNFFNEFCDKQAFYTFIALDTLFGSYHHDWAHNHKIYFDPYKGKFSPIAWDLRFWTPAQNKDVVEHLMLERIKLNPLFEYERDMVFTQLARTYPPDKINELVDAFSKQVRRDLASDKNKDRAYYLQEQKKWISGPYNMAEQQKSIDIRKKDYALRYSTLIRHINYSTVTYRTEDIGKYTKVTFFVLGNSPAVLESRDKPFIMDTNFNGYIDDTDLKATRTALYAGRKFVGQSPESTELSHTRHLVHATIKYTIFFENNDSEEFDISKYVFVNPLTSGPITPTLADEDTVADSDSIHPWTLPQKLPISHTESRFEGEVSVNSTMSFKSDTVVIIEPGTTFHLARNASLMFKGKVLANGTAEKPIQFIADNPSEPWGIVAVQGKGTTGSVFRYCEFEDGSTAVADLIHYTAPFNIHNMDEFEVSNCKIGTNHVGDDGMHVAYSTGKILNSQFIATRSDGLDIDISNVELRNNIFYKTGNDGLDVMTSKIQSSNNIFIDTGDKGMSVGEWSEVSIEDSLFVRTEIGLAVKDKSVVRANNLIFIDSRLEDILLFNKNKRYDEGGSLEIDNLYLLGNLTISQDSLSSFTVVNKNENVLPVWEDNSWLKVFENTSDDSLLKQVKETYEQ